MAPKVPNDVDEAIEQLKAFDPSYVNQNEETAKASVNNLVAAASNPEKQENLGQSTSENLADPSTKDNIKQLIIQLAKDQSTIEQLFQEVADLLRKVDELKVSGELLPDWIAIRDFYRQLVKQSKEQASNLSSFAKSFATILLPSIVENKDDPDTVKAILDVYIEEVQLRKKQSQAISDGFTKLKDDLNAYNTRFDNFAKEKDAELTREVNELNGRLVEVNLKITALNTIITATGIGLGVSIFAGAVGGVLLMSPLAPIGALVIGISVLAGLGSLAGLIYALVEKNNKEQEKKDIEQQIADKVAEQQKISKANGLLKNIPSKITSIVQLMAGFNQIWDWIVGELTKIEADIYRAEKFAKIWKALEKQLNAIQKNWNDLSDVLDSYVANIITVE